MIPSTNRSLIRDETQQFRMNFQISALRKFLDFQYTGGDKIIGPPLVNAKK